VSALSRASQEVWDVWGAGWFGHPGNGPWLVSPCRFSSLSSGHLLAGFRPVAGWPERVQEAAMRLVNHSSELIYQVYQREKVEDVAQFPAKVRIPLK
jgi:hypothetical protein